MPKLALTDIAVRGLKPTSPQQTYWDAAMPNFGVRVGLRSKAFVLLVGNERRRITLGAYPAMSLAQARQAARGHMAERVLGIAAPPKPKSPSFSEALTSFIGTHSKQKHKASTARENRRILERHFAVVFGDRMLHTIKAGDISKIIEALEETPSSAEHAFRVVRTFFNFCVKRGYLGTSPVAHLEPPRKGPDRERVLSDDELVKVWRKAQEIGSPYGTIVQLLILTGQRTGEIAALKWEWVSTTGIDFPAPLAKNGRAWRIPVGELTARILASVPKQGALLFPARGHPDQPFRGFGVRKLVLDQCGVVGFTHHDLRRTYATNLARLSVPIHVLEKLLNHSSGVLRGVAAIYNRYSYEEEMRSAQALWEKHVASLIDPDYDARVPGTQPGAVATGSLFGSYRDEDVIETPTQRVGPLQPATRCAP